MSERAGALGWAVVVCLVCCGVAARATSMQRREREAIQTPEAAAPQAPAFHGAGDSLQSAAAAAARASAESTTVIRVFAEGLHSEAGEVRVSLFAQADGFPDHGERCLQWGFARLLGDRAYMVFRPVEPGRYAVAAFHDEDGNGTMRKDWLGRPREGWGVSRDAEGHFGPPRFEDAAFEATSDTMTIHLQLRY